MSATTPTPHPTATAAVGSLVPGVALPDFPWDALAPFTAQARQHPEGLIDLSVGTPVDPVPAVAQDALRQASNSPGYPTTHGSNALRESAAGWLQRARQAQVSPEHILPTIGSKELIAWLPTFLGLGPGDVVVHPPIAYPTYAVGAQMAGAQAVAADLHDREAAQFLAEVPVRLIWVNSPSNPTGAVLETEQLREVVRWARAHGAVVASDECYAGFDYASPSAVSILDPRVCAGSHENLLLVHSLSKRSNLAGYRAGIVTGDPALVAGLLQVRKHLGLMVPAPVQHAMAACYGDDRHAHAQQQRYARRRELLVPALEHAGFGIEHSRAGLYLWASRDQDCWLTVQGLAQLGIVAAPGSFYGPAGQNFVRVALTATDENIEQAVARLQGHGAAGQKG